MKARTCFFAAIVLALLLGTINSAVAQKKSKMKPEEILAVLRPGQWVKMEGIVQKDFAVMTANVEILTGDFSEAEWSIEAVARSIDSNKQEFKMLLLPIKTRGNTEYKAKRSMSAFNSFADLKDGMWVEVDGIYLKDGTFLAVEIEDKSADLVTKAGLENQVEAVGKVEKVNVAKSTVTLMGIIFQLTDKTEGQHALK